MDIYEFGTDHIEMPVFKSQSVPSALAYAHTQFGAKPDRWVNQFVIQSEYEDYIRAGRPLTWP